MQDGTDTKAHALAAAALLERWADAVPDWDPNNVESFAARRYAAEKLLEKKLR